MATFTIQQTCKLKTSPDVPSCQSYIEPCMGVRAGNPMFNCQNVEIPMVTFKYTVDDFEAQKIKHAKIGKLWADEYSPNKKNPYDKAAKEATAKLREIEEYLKKNGLIPYSDHELVIESLNNKYPNAQSREIVVHNGIKYRKKFIPLTLSKTGKTVKKWESTWEIM